ncbi:hypothetical protein F2P81_010033 [Scophthalmus maximus]|uniref:Fringe-like glycosyltransferase domain-containing protein n=1 Tax=Scophthalmus maximus TaxID=52904 RepID=A0A6A4SWS9_SCOMX|nr:hypothetical protein F2P81_010033 [Scophthalmus maximus]
MKPWSSGGTFMATAEHIRLPDDCTVGYIVEALLGVTLSYGTVENNRNTVNVKGPFSVNEDPTRLNEIVTTVLTCTSSLIS